MWHDFFLPYGLEHSTVLTDHTFLLHSSEARHPGWFRLSDIVNGDEANTEVQRSLGGTDLESFE